MARYDMYKQNEWYQILKWHVFVHVLTALYQLYNLCMSHRTHHETILHSRHILQLTSLANICVNIAVRTISHNQTCGELKRGWQEINFRNSEHTMRIDTELCFFLQWCWFRCTDALHCCTLSATLFVVFLFLWSCNKQYARGILSPAWKNMPMMAIIASLPLAISALSFLVFSAGSEEVNTLNPKSPAYAALPGVCSWETSQKAM